MNGRQIISKSQISQIDIKDDDKSLDGSLTFAEIKSTIEKAINVVNEALPKMKAAGVDMKDAAKDVEGLLRNIIRKGWGSSEVDFYVTRDDRKAIACVTPQHIDDIIEQVKEIVANY